MAKHSVKWKEPKGVRDRRLASMYRQLPAGCLRVLAAVGLPCLGLFAAQRIWLPDFQFDWLMACVAMLSILLSVGILAAAIVWPRIPYIVTSEGIGTELSRHQRPFTESTTCLVVPYQNVDYLVVSDSYQHITLFGRKVPGFFTRFVRAYPLPEDPSGRSAVLAVIEVRLQTAMPPEWADLVAEFRETGGEVVAQQAPVAEADDAPKPVEWFFAVAQSALYGYFAFACYARASGEWNSEVWWLGLFGFLSFLLGPGTVLGLWKHGPEFSSTQTRLKFVGQLNLLCGMLIFPWMIAWMLAHILDTYLSGGG